ncbi:unnamed protein product [Aphanomyces euteiches]
MAGRTVVSNGELRLPSAASSLLFSPSSMQAALFLAALLAVVSSRPEYSARIPNGDNIPLVITPWDTETTAVVHAMHSAMPTALLASGLWRCVSKILTATAKRTVRNWAILAASGRKEQLPTKRRGCRTQVWRRA